MGTRNGRDTVRGRLWGAGVGAGGRCIKFLGPEHEFSDYLVSASIVWSLKWRGESCYYGNSIKGGIAKGLSLVSCRRIRPASCDVWGSIQLTRSRGVLPKDIIRKEGMMSAVALMHPSRTIGARFLAGDDFPPPKQQTARARFSLSCCVSRHSILLVFR